MNLERQNALYDERYLSQINNRWKYLKENEGLKYHSIIKYLENKRYID